MKEGRKKGRKEVFYLTFRLLGSFWKKNMTDIFTQFSFSSNHYNVLAIVNIVYKYETNCLCAYVA